MMRIILFATGGAAPSNCANGNLCNAAARSVYVLCKVRNAVIYSIHRQVLETSELACCDLQYLQAAKRSRCCNVPYRQARQGFKCCNLQ